MKLCGIVAIAALVVVLCSQAQSQAAAGPDECCFNFYRKPIPARQIREYKLTHPSCPKKSVILTTVRNKKLCANPEVQEIQNIMDKLDNLWDTQTTASV